MENHYFNWVNPLTLWPFSIAMWLFTRGYFPEIPHDVFCRTSMTSMWRTRFWSSKLKATMTVEKYIEVGELFPVQAFPGLRWARQQRGWSVTKLVPKLEGPVIRCYKWIYFLYIYTIYLNDIYNMYTIYLNDIYMYLYYICLYNMLFIYLYISIIYMLYSIYSYIIYIVCLYNLYLSNLYSYNTYYIFS